MYMYIYIKLAQVSIFCILQASQKTRLRQMLKQSFYLNVVVQILHTKKERSFVNVVLFSDCTNECPIKDVCPI